MENCSDNEDMKLSPLFDDDFSELTRSEIVRWAKTLNITPSELFALSHQELEHLLSQHLSKEIEDNNVEKFIRDYEEKEKEKIAHEARRARWKRLLAMKNILLKQQKERLKGGNECRTVWQILASAAVEIESMYGQAGGLRSRQRSGRQNLGMQQRSSGGAVDSSESVDTSFRSFPTMSSILKSFPEQKAVFVDNTQDTPPYMPVTYNEAVATQIPKGVGYQSYNISQADSGLGVTFSQTNKCGGPSFVQGSLDARDMDERDHNQGYPRARSPDNHRYIPNSQTDAPDDQTYYQGSPIRRGDYPTFVQGNYPTYNPQHNQTVNQQTPGGRGR